MTGINLLKAALDNGVKVLPTHFLEHNDINATYLGDVDRECYSAYVIEEDGELKDKVVFQYI